MKLALATPLYPPEIGGPATYAKLLAEGLPARGIAVELVKFADVRHYPKLLRHYAYYRRMLRAARSADAVLALDPVSTGLPALRAAQKAGKPFFVKIVGDYAWEQGRQRFGVTEELDEFVRTPQKSGRVRALQRIERAVAYGAARVIVPSAYLKEIVSAWGIPEDRIAVIHNAVQIETGGAIPRAVAALPRPLVVSAGRLVPWKHVDGIIDAVAGIEGASLAIIGEGPDRAALEAHAKNMLPGRHVFTGALPHADLLAAITAADAFVLNSSYEGFSHLLVESLLAGAPTVATRIGGNAEVIASDEDGTLVPAGDVSCLASAIRDAIAESARSEQRENRRQRAAARFSEAAMLDTTAALLMQETYS